MVMPNLTYSIISASVYILITFNCCLLPYLSWANQSKPPANAAKENEFTQIVGYEYLGQAIFPTGYKFKDTIVGGLSGITYDPKLNCYYAISDDRSQINPARFYSLTIDLTDGHLDQENIVFSGVTKLTDEHGLWFRTGTLDPEGIALSAKGIFYIASEGVARKGIPPFINGFEFDGRQKLRLPIPKKYLPTGKSGIRSNLAFESLAITPDDRYLYSGLENALLQDGPAADLNQKSLSRIVQYDLTSGKIAAEFIYAVEAVAQAPQPSNGTHSNGLVELIAMDNYGTLLAMERSYSQGKGVTVRIFQVSTQDAFNVVNVSSLLAKNGSLHINPDWPVSKKEILNFSDFIPVLDNLEGMTFGPTLPNGRQILIVVSDNNFSKIQRTQFIALALNIETTGSH